MEKNAVSPTVVRSNDETDRRKKNYDFHSLCPDVRVTMNDLNLYC